MDILAIPKWEKKKKEKKEKKHFPHRWSLRDRLSFSLVVFFECGNWISIHSCALHKSCDFHSDRGAMNPRQRSVCQFSIQFIFIYSNLRFFFRLISRFFCLFFFFKFIHKSNHHTLTAAIHKCIQFTHIMVHSTDPTTTKNSIFLIFNTLTLIERDMRQQLLRFQKDSNIWTKKNDGRHWFRTNHTDTKRWRDESDNIK